MRSLRGGGGRQPCRFASDCGNYLEEDEEEGLFKAKLLTRLTLRRTRRTSGTLLLLSTIPGQRSRARLKRGVLVVYYDRKGDILRRRERRRVMPRR